MSWPPPERRDDSGRQTKSGPHTLTAEQLAEFKKFKNEMKTSDLRDCMKMTDDDLLIRFFIGRNFKTKPAVEMITKNLQWRKERQVDDVFTITEKKVPKDILYQSHVDGLCGFYGFDIEGYPVYWEKPNGKGLDKLVHDMNKDDLFMWHIAAVERGREVTKYLNVDRITMVMDLSALGARALMFGRVSTMLREQMKYDQENYPECMRKMFIINAPFGFSSAYTAIKVFLDARVQEKITICSGRADGDAMSKWILPNQTPSEFGGTADVDWDASRLKVTSDVNVFKAVVTYTEQMNKVAQGRGKSQENNNVQENSEHATQPDQEKEKQTNHHHHHHSGKHHHHGNGHHHHHHHHENGEVHHDDLLFTCISYSSASDTEEGSVKSPSPTTTPRGLNRSGRKHSLVRNDSLRNTGRDDQSTESTKTRCCCVIS